jgi:hypothetical protein
LKKADTILVEENKLGNFRDRWDDIIKMDSLSYGAANTAQVSENFRADFMKINRMIWV